MNKPQLLELVNSLPDDLEGILVASDAEGNEFNLLDNAYSIELVSEDGLKSGYIDGMWSEEDLLEDSEDGKIPDNFKKVAVLWPI